MKELKINQEISSKQIRLKETGELISRYEALNKAKDLEVDLIELTTYGDPIVSVCILYPYDKYCYQQKKREKQLKANQIKIVNKEVRLGPQIDTNDLLTKEKQIRKFLEEKSRVNVVVVFKGREVNYKEQGEKILCQVAVDLEDCSKVESTPKFDGRKMNMVLIYK